jgi:hypothetical protein
MIRENLPSVMLIRAKADELIPLTITNLEICTKSTDKKEITQI